VKNSKECPKCKSGDIVKLPGSVEPYYSGNNVALGRKRLVSFLSIPQFVKVAKFLCCKCGFAEEWVESAEDIAKIKETYG